MEYTISFPLTSSQYNVILTALGEHFNALSKFDQVVWRFASGGLGCSMHNLSGTAFFSCTNAEDFSVLVGFVTGFAK